MISETIGSSTAGNNTGGATADRTSIAAGEAAIGDTDDVSFTIITKVAATDTGTVTFNAGNTGGTRVYKVTVDSTCALGAPTYSNANAQARATTGSGGMFVVSGAGWIFEKLSIFTTAATNAIDGTFAYTLRRMFIHVSATGTSGFSVNSNKTITASNVVVVIRGTGVGFGSGASGAIFNCYHVSVYLAATAFAGLYAAGGGGSSCNAYACVVQGSPSNWVNGGAGTFGGAENVGQDATVAGTSPTLNQTDVFANVASTTEDLSMAAGPYVVTDRSGTIADLATDIKGAARVAPIDAGCDYIAPSVIGDLAANLTAYFRMDEASGTRVDRSSSALDLTDNNSVGSATGHLGANCADFTQASSESLTHADDAAYAFTTLLSINVWVNLASNSPPALGQVVGQGSYLTIGGWHVYVDTAGAWRLALSLDAADASSAVVATGNAFMSAPAWHMLTYTYDGGATGNSSRVRLFLDGVEKEVTTFTGTIPASLQNATGNLSVGFYDGVGGAYYDDKMEHLALYAKRLTNANIKYLYNAGTGADPTVVASSAGTITSMLMLMGVG